MNQKKISPIVKTAFFIILIDLLGIGLLIPIQPFYAQQFGVSPAYITLLGTAYAGMQFLFAPIWGAISDKYGRRRVLLSTIVLTALGHLLFAASGSFAMLLIARCITGLGAANLSTAQAVVADVSEPEERSRNMGILGAAFGIGFILGPAIGGILSQYRTYLPALFAAALAVTNWFFVRSYLPETRKEGALPSLKPSFSKLLSIGHYPAGIKWCLLITLLATVAFSFMEYTISLFIQANWLPISLTPIEDSTRLSTTFLIVVGITSAVVQGGLMGRLSRKWSEPKLMTMGLGVLAVGMLSVPVLAFTGSFILFQLSAVLLATGSGLLTPSVAAYLSTRGGTNNHGAVLASNQSSSSLGRIIGPTLAGLLFEQSINLPYLLAGVIFVGLTVMAAATLLDGEEAG